MYKMNKRLNVVSNCRMSGDIDSDVHKRRKKHKHKSSKHIRPAKHVSMASPRLPLFASSMGSMSIPLAGGNDGDDDVDDEHGDDDELHQNRLKELRDSDDEEELVVDVTTASRQQQMSAAASSSNSLKLKFKLGGQTLGETSVAIIHEPDEENQLIEVVDDVPAAVASDISDEDAWLEALESGKLDEYDEMRRMKDPALMTSRQKALLESKTSHLRQPAARVLPEQIMLPLHDGKVEKEMTEEMIKKRELKAKKRRQQAQEKREKDKIQTIDRLLKKQESKPKGNKALTYKKSVQEVPKFTYICNGNGYSISVPVGHQFPMQPSSQATRSMPIDVPRCGVPPCTNAKRYSCSKSGVPLCSLDCYKRNIVLKATAAQV